MARQFTTALDTEPAALERKSRVAHRDISTLLANHTDRIVTLLCVYAAFRVLFFAAAFPLFNNVDEQSQFASIHLFVDRHLQSKRLPVFDPESARIASLYSSAEYMNSHELLVRTGEDIPISQAPPGRRAIRFASEFSYWSRHVNFEAQSPPLYYVAAAAWYRLGALLGIKDWGLPYWVRFLNAPLYGMLVWVSYKLVRSLFGVDRFQTLAVPALIAVFPQDVFFGLNRDVFSAPLAALALLLLTKAMDARLERFRSLLLASFMVGLGFLVNVSNCVLFAALAITVWAWLGSCRQTRRAKLWVVTATALAASGLPLVWMMYNRLVIGDITGSRAKVAYLGWTLKPISTIAHHPLFSWNGLTYFLLSLTRTFWRGEYVWHGQPMRSVAADWFYVLSSASLALMFLVHFWRGRARFSQQQTLAGLHAFSIVCGSLLFMAAISIAFDFDTCPYPSRQRPFFVSGRIISGALLPFVLIYTGGLEVLTNRIRKWVHPSVVLACVVGFITVSEIIVRSEVLSSRFNFFNLLLH